MSIADSHVGDHYIGQLPMHPPSILFQTSAPWLLKTLDSLDAIFKFLSATMSAKPNLKLILLDGNKMQVSSDFSDELAKGFQLPGYFGRNLNALSECLADLEWLHGSGYILIIQHAEAVLRSETPEKLEGFLDVLKSVGSEWSHPESYGRPWKPAPTPVHAVLLCKDQSWMDEIPRLGSE
jgi:hypothetical protein